MGQKSRAKRLARQERIASGEHGRSRAKHGGMSQKEQWLLVGVIAVVIVALGLVAKTAFTSSPASAPAASPASDTMSSMNNDASDGPGIAVGKRVAMANMAMPASSGSHVSLAKYRGKKLIMYFYEGVT